MSQTELLRTQLDTVRLEMQQLQVENNRLREGQPEGAALVDARKEADQLRVQSERLAKEVEDLRNQLHEARNAEASVAGELDAVTAELQKQREVQRVDAELIAQLEARCQKAEERCEQLETERERAELNYYRKWEVERSKWEEREERLVKQLNETIRGVGIARSEDGRRRTTEVGTTPPPLMREHTERCPSERS